MAVEARRRRADLTLGHHQRRAAGVDSSLDRVDVIGRSIDVAGLAVLYSGAMRAKAFRGAAGDFEPAGIARFANRDVDVRVQRHFQR